MLPPLNALRAFEAVTRHGKYADAADELCVTTSAISHQIRVLEEFFGARLINRDGQKFGLTREGEVLQGDLQQAFNLIKRATTNLQTECKSSPLGISTTPLFAVKWLRSRLHRFWTLHQDIDMHFYHSNTVTDVTDGSIQVAIQWLDKREANEGDVLLMEGNLTPACSPALLDGSASLQTPADLSSFSLLHDDDPTLHGQPSLWHEWLVLAHAADITVDNYTYYEDGNVRIQAAIEGEGFTLICPTVQAEDIAAGRLVCPFDITLQSHAYYIVTPSGIGENANARKFINWVSSEV